MSFIRDDVSLPESLQRLQASILQTKTVTEKTTKDSNSTDNTQEFEKIELSELANKYISENLKKIEDSQENINMLEKADKGLSDVADYLDKIKSDVKKLSKEGLSEEEKKEINKSIKENLKNIDKVAKDTDFNGKKLLDGSLKDRLIIKNEKDDTINISTQLKDTSVKGLGLQGSKSLK